jgi:hypothetical protein
MLNRDRVKEGYVSTFGIGHDQLPAETNRKVTDLFFSAANVFLEGNVSVIVEAAFQHKLWEEVVHKWSGMSRLFFIVCEADPTVCAQRHLDRGLNDPSREFCHGDKRVTEFKKSGEYLPPGNYAPPTFDVPTLRVSTADGYSPALLAIVDFITSGIAEESPAPGPDRQV